MHILFVNHHHLDSNSGIHIFNLANQLTQLRVQCTVCVPNYKETASALGKCNFDVLNFNDLTHKMQTGKIDLIHAWTPRERVRVFTETLAKEMQIPYVVHLEDNEEAILQFNLGISIAEILDMSDSHLSDLIPEHLSHPLRYKQFLGTAKGLTMVIDTLQDFAPVNQPMEVIWPGYDHELNWQRSPDEALRRRLNIAAHEHVVVYTGNVHPANRREVFSLYLAIGLLNRSGVQTRLVRTGMDFVPLYNNDLKMLDRYCISLGHLSHSVLPTVLSIADVLVQPGRADAFNIYRFPSKLPEYLASGKPVILPAVNIGRFLKNGEEAILLQQGDTLDIVQKLEPLLLNQAKRQQIGTNGRHFAEANLRWTGSAQKLFAFYQNLLGK